ncbi:MULTISPECIES: hypothetical protein [unclassified Ensifer]|uniref:hypothetical protein n=1 Tax=unclassified Ensifer TaxID=2633371 RepID=UPI000813745D|nr:MULTISPECIES: hypothetical protein [unclassified Ensifer]OCP09087.1 hypothetical protein BC374_20280 [Ensifer sp. LC13]OCP09870.1 hypothetical protein BC362_09055 [Ensifer sp. LC14]OCP31585.1 hypothetical protein BC364_23265 [Ensifer sp. LC499]
MKRDQPASRAFKSIGGSDVVKRVRAKVIDPAEAVYRGHYDLAEFIARYGLTPMEAREIFVRLGPARSNLDQYMRERDIKLSD